MAKKKKLKPTLKQQRFIDNYIENGGNATQAVLAVYNTNNKVDATNIGCENLRKPHIREIIQSKIRSIDNKTANDLINKNLVSLALDTAHSDLQDPDPKVRAQAREYILKVQKYLKEHETSNNETTHNHLHLPKWKG